MQAGKFRSVSAFSKLGGGTGQAAPDSQSVLAELRRGSGTGLTKADLASLLNTDLVQINRVVGELAGQGLVKVKPAESAAAQVVEL